MGRGEPEQAPTQEDGSALLPPPSANVVPAGEGPTLIPEAAASRPLVLCRWPSPSCSHGPPQGRDRAPSPRPASKPPRH